MTDTDEIIIGDIKIAGNVLERMVRESASRIAGVSTVRDIAVTPKEDSLIVEISLIVDYKTVYPDVGREVQAAVADDINRTTAIKVDEVNVSIERLDFSKD